MTERRKNYTINEEQILQIIQSAVKQAGHLKPSPDTLERLKEGDYRMKRIEEMIQNHANSEESVLERIQGSISHMITDQDMRHKIIDDQLKDLKPIRDGLSAANTIKKTVLWLSGFIAGLSLVILAWKEVFKK